MNYNDLPKRWKEKLKTYLKPKKRDKLQCGDFPNFIKIRFDDGSKAEFYYAIAIPAPEFDEIGIFTEHCGYHLIWLSPYTALYVNGKRMPARKIMDDYKRICNTQIANK
jgi:hypothetical protein